MSEHVQRAEPSYLSFFIILIENKKEPLPSAIRVPEREYPATPSIPKSKPLSELPIVCQETPQERQSAKNRQAVLCYYEADRDVISNASGECYATYRVSVTGHVKNIEGFGCMHDALLEPAKTAKAMRRSGDCIFEFDLTPEAVISKIRQMKCTDAVLKFVTLASLNECSFRRAMTDGSAISRLYMPHQIDVDVYNKREQKIPVHAAFGEKNSNKPYVVFD